MPEQKYQILSRVGEGGMAEVWKGKSVIQGFERVVAIKRILPNMAKDANYAEMFLDEACLLLHLAHANIVQTFDVGESGGAFFIVMEWIDGDNLKVILQNLAARGQKMRTEIALFITAEVCKGLNHAHHRCDLDGKPLHIVHRDVSPPNIVISREGEVKLIDFGLANSKIQVNVTPKKVVKGKFSYLSPEQAMGNPKEYPVDGRTDIFALGAVLWEMLSGHRLFEGDSPKNTILMVRKCEVPSLQPYGIDAELDAIVHRALTRSSADRYQSAEAFGRALSAYLFKHQLTVTNYALADWVRDLSSQQPRAEVRKPAVDQSSTSVNKTVQKQLAEFKPLSLEERLQKLSERLDNLQHGEFVPMMEGGDEQPQMPFTESLLGEPLATNISPSSGFYRDFMATPRTVMKDTAAELKRTASALLSNVGPVSIGPPSLPPQSLGPKGMAPQSLGPQGMGPQKPAYPNSVLPNRIAPRGTSSLKPDSLAAPSFGPKDIAPSSLAEKTKAPQNLSSETEKAESPEPAIMQTLDFVRTTDAYEPVPGPQNEQAEAIHKSMVALLSDATSDVELDEARAQRRQRASELSAYVRDAMSEEGVSAHMMVVFLAVLGGALLCGGCLFYFLM